MQIRRLIGAALVLCAFSGCGGSERPDGLPPLHPCEITITQGGNPLGGASVRLVRDDGTSAWPITGRTDSSGVAKITSHAQFAGAPEGTFKVLVSKTEMEPSKYTQPAKDAPQAEWDEYLGATTTEVRRRIAYVEPQYDDVKAAPHSITIVKGKNKATFDVGEAVEIIAQ